MALISATWHEDIVNRARDACAARLVERGVLREHIALAAVPGAFEIPLLAQKLAREGLVDAVIACALVVNGGIYRHEFVASAVIDGLMRTQLATGVPVLSVVLTPRDFHEHETHRQFFHEHMVTKGREAADACIATWASHDTWVPALAA